MVAIWAHLKSNNLLRQLEPARAAFYLPMIKFPLALLTLVLCLGACAKPSQKPPGIINNLPLFVITTTETIPNEPKIMAHLGIIASDGENKLGDAFNAYDGSIGIEIRGSSSQFWPKKQYGFETRDAEGNDLDVSLLGLPEESDWVLYAPYSDKSLIRNTLVYDTARAMGHYASRQVLVELYLNQEYMGVYVLFEKIKRNKNRVDIGKNSDDLSGGYLLELESTYQYKAGEAYIVSERFADKAFFFEYPKAEDLSQEQKSYMQTYLNDFETALYGDAFADPIEGYAPFIDQPSFIDFILINELVKNRDAFFRSTFMYKDKQDVLYLGPVWDFDLALGNDETEIGSPQGFLLDELNLYWAERLLQDPAFRGVLIERYKDLRKTVWSNSAFQERIDLLTRQLSQAQTRNFERWPILGVYVPFNRFVGDTYEAEIAYLQDWLTTRLQWLDEHIDEISLADFKQSRSQLR